MFNYIFYHQILSRSSHIFGTLFDKTYIIRRDKNGEEQERIMVPIAYGPRERPIVRLRDDPTLKRPTALTVPRMAFEFVKFAYNKDRKLNRVHHNEKFIQSIDNKLKLSQWEPAPWDISVNLYIVTKYMNDGNQIIEQILPWFTPSYNVTMNIIPELDIRDDISITLNTLELSDNYEDDYIERREINWVLNFTMFVNFYGPIKEQGIIRKVQVDTHLPAGGTSAKITDEQIEKTPRELRLTVTPDPIDAKPIDDYGFTETWESFSDNKKYDPVSGQDVEIED